MAQVDVISTLFDKELRRKMSDNPRLPFSMFANFEYEGELKNAWESVIVPISPKITMTDSSSENGGDIRKTTLTDIPASERNVGKSELKVDKLHRYREKFSKLEEIQTAYLIKGNRMQDLLTAMNEAVEKGILATIDAMLAANTGQVIDAGEALTEDNISKHIMKLRTALSKKEVPMDNRILIVSPDVSGLIAMAKILNGTDDASQAAIDGWLGKFAGFKVYESNLITGNKLYAFREKAYNYVRQMMSADVNKATDANYFNVLGEIAHGGKVFDQNIEQIVQLKYT